MPSHRSCTVIFVPPTQLRAFSAMCCPRTATIDAFTTETSCLTIVGAVMQDIRLRDVPGWLKAQTALVIGGHSTSRKGWFRGGWRLLAILCNNHASQI